MSQPRPPAPDALAPPQLDQLVADHAERQCREQLSALLDGALPADEARFLLRRLQHDHALAGHWERWQVYGDALRGSAPALLPADFAQRVSAALAAEAEGPRQAPGVAVPGRAGWMRWGGGAALAASVAVAALFVAQRQPLPAGGAPAEIEIAASGLPGIDPAPVAAQADRAGNPQGAGAAGVAAAALAVADAPRRSARTDRRTASRRATAPARASAAVAATPVAAAPLLVASAAGNAASTPSPVSVDPFAGDGALVARPWPRAVVTGLSSHALNVDYGRLPAQDASAERFEPFAPQLPVAAPAPQPRAATP